jgi:transcriptional repressor NrdR
VRCPGCGNDETKVVDSRSVEDGSVIRRRRLCCGCERRFTTFERSEPVAIVVVKRSEVREPFAREKIVQGVSLAAKGRGIEPEVVEALVDEIEDEARLHGGDVTTEWLGVAVLDRLRAIDPVTCLRFASVYKDFTDIGDFEREMRLIKLDTV